MSSSRPGCLAFVFAIFRARAPSDVPADFPATNLPYRIRDDFLSPAERSFYGVLASVIQNRYVICPKVNLADILFVAGRDIAARNRIDRKHVDFLLCDPTSMQPRAAIELDDASHQRADRQSRDQFMESAFAAAGLPLLRFSARAGYSVSDISAQIASSGSGESADTAAEPVATPAGTPVCPKCDEPMVLRANRKGTNAGQAFYGCVNFPRCRQMAPVNTGL